MCIANYEASGSQVQLTLERGLPAMLGSFTSKQLPFPSLSYDMVHCARCGVDWDSKGKLRTLLYDIDGCYSSLYCILSSSSTYKCLLCKNKRR